MFETVVGAFIEIIDSLMSLFTLGSWAEKHTSESSKVGESGMDQEARRWQKRIIGSWYSISLIATLLLAGAGTFIWHYLARK